MGNAAAGVAVDEAAVNEVRIAPSMLDARGFDAWVRPHWRSMSLLAVRLAGGSSEDVLAEALLAAWRKRAQFDAGRGTARSWLLAIVADRAYKSHRSTLSRPRSAAPTTATGSGPDAQPDAGDVAARIDLERALIMLTDRQRLAIDLYYAIGLPIAEVAAVMGCTDGTVKLTLRDARAKLRSLLTVEETS